MATRVNYHVIKDQEGTLRVRFDSGIVVKAAIIETDPENDLAIIRVNLNAIKQKPYVFPINNNSETYVGQRVISIGSPLNFIKFNNTLTQGAVGKLDKKIIYHDAAIDVENSGSPLISLDGNAIGVNTFIQSDEGKAIYGAISIDESRKLLEIAKQKIINQDPPSMEVYPAFPSEPYKYSLMDTLFSSENDLNKFLYSKYYYNIKGKKYDIFLVTPLQRYKFFLRQDINLLQNAKNQINNKNYDKEFDPVRGYQSSYITVWVIPNPDLTKESIAKAIFITTIGTAMCFPYLGLFPTYNIKFKGKYKSVLLKKGNKTIISFSEGKAPLTNEAYRSIYTATAPLHSKVVDRENYYGVFRHDYRYFITPEELYFEVESEGKDIDKIVIPEKIKEKIKKEFKPYEDYLNKK